MRMDKAHWIVVGLTALLLPIGITRTNRRKDIPVNIGMVVLFILLGLKATLFGLGTDGLSRWDGAILLTAFVLYLWSCFRQQEDLPSEEYPVKTVKPWLAVLMIAGGLAALILGGRLFVNSAVALAKALHVSDKFIAVTILAGGTSLPELATCVVAAAKKKGQLALGNILGSNVFNILLILGGSALIHPLSFAGINFVDLGVLLASTLMLGTACLVGRRNEIDRLDGALFLLLFVAYMTYLIIHL